VRFIWIVAACLCMCDSGALRAQTLEVTPSYILTDETATIRASGLQPNEAVTIQGALRDGAGNQWTSQAEFLANAEGIVDVSQQAPIKGSYNDISAMGLVWSMKPEGKHVSAYVPPSDLGVQTIQFRLMRDGKAVSAVQLEQRAVAEGVRQIKVAGLLHGVLFEAGGNGHHQGYWSLGVLKAAYRSGRRHGWPPAALRRWRWPIFGMKIFRQTLESIPLEYFGNALNWMSRRPEILADGIAVVGSSRGGELALQLASMYPQIGAVVAYVPANVRYPACCGNTRVPYAWTLQGQALAYVMPRENPQNRLAVMQASIAIERAHAAVLLISGEDDGVWASSRMAGEIVDRLKSAHFSYPVEHLKYPHAGHLAGRPEIVPAWHGAMRHPVSGKDVDLGGMPKGDAQSSLDAIPVVLEFLRTNLNTSAPLQ
jgi:dienelactone hydrolase